MAAAMAAKRPETVGQLFARASADEAISNGLNTVSYNLAIEARIRMKDTLGARRLLERMLRGKDGAPPPRTDTFNVMISALGERGEATNGSSMRWRSVGSSRIRTRPARC